MFRTTSKSVRVKGIPLDSNQEEFMEEAEYCSRDLRRPWPQPVNLGSSKISLAIEREDQVGTITLPSPKHKEEALKYHNTEWEYDDNFNGITTLYSSDDPEVDACAVHGLNGNAFESWVATKNQKMWLRDILPLSKPFDKARIMTFGYSSRLRDRGNLSGITVWSQDLLRSVSSLRKPKKERERPILFVCHSMGGLVARQAMIELDKYGSQSEYNGISPAKCALLFLSTPRSGSLEADWSDFLTDIAQLTMGVRKEIVKTLGSFDPMSTESQREFMNMNIIPPFDAFFETRVTSVARIIHRQIVIQQSASLSNCTAKGMPDVDHNTICKFESKFGGFEQVADKLRHLKNILDGKSDVLAVKIDKPWDSPPVASNSFLPAGKKFFEGKGLRKIPKTQGRNDYSSLVMAGIGGIGKTTAVLEIARKNKDQRNIFFVHATDGDSLRKAYLDLAMQIGHEHLLKDYQGRDLYNIWRNNTSDEKIERFKKWLGDEDNQSALLILDDIDGMKEFGRNPFADVPDQAKNILLTTRNPNIRLRDDCKIIKLNNMEVDDIVTILEKVRSLEDEDTEDSLDVNDSDVLLSIAKSVHGHPLAACIAMKYIIQVQSLDDYTFAGRDFVSMLSGSDHKARMTFLQYKPQMPSIMETFMVSKERLSHPQGPAWSLMEVLSLLETDKSIVDFKKFFALSNIENTEAFPDFDILGLRKEGIMPLLHQIEEVSFMERTRRSKPLRIHPLWAECTRQLMGINRMLSLIRQILTICYYSTTTVSSNSDGGERMSCHYYPHVKHCMKICRSFGIGVSSLKMQKEIDMLVHSLTT
ncbi:uncharacterized protein EAE97_001321 [Botrytis byssoidea]|uniref:NB-ARC domain-containing protein n=1 Tax=Botrytis byssoidea TaxID=139641 RepID=A0A9P5IY01_9HELO|nr:uncharacterized protein EAE97_001321 [Botrytis byssoidea]KAF7953923.1 hypothetical protein EAE97_001321 [Botrytis byssoidea]